MSLPGSGKPTQGTYHLAQFIGNRDSPTAAVQGLSMAAVTYGSATYTYTSKKGQVLGKEAHPAGPCVSSLPGTAALLQTLHHLCQPEWQVRGREACTKDITTLLLRMAGRDHCWGSPFHYHLQTMPSPGITASLPPLVPFRLPLQPQLFYTLTY